MKWYLGLVFGVLVVVTLVTVYLEFEFNHLEKNPVLDSLRVLRDRELAVEQTLDSMYAEGVRAMGKEHHYIELYGNYYSYTGKETIRWKYTFPRQYLTEIESVTYWSRTHEEPMF